MASVLKVENLSKLYRLGEVGTGTLSHDLNRFFAKVRGKEDPFSQVGQINDRTKKANSDYVWALKDINFEVQQGEVLGIIGRNGAGKSTLLKLISQITSPTKGSIKAKGRIASLLEVGTGMHPEMTARENIYLNGSMLGMRKKEISKKFDEIIDFAGCRMYVDTPIKRFSSGMRVRLGFAVAAFLEPEILIVDEVLAVGDAEFQKKAVGKMKDISGGEGRTVLFVSHNLASVSSLCKTGILIENGSIANRGQIEKVINAYTGKSKGITSYENFSGKGNHIRSIQVKNNSKLNAITLSAEEEIIIEINLEINFSNKYLVLGVAIKNYKSEKIGTVVNNKAKDGLNILKISSFSFNNGSYSLDVALFESQGETLEYLDSVLSFDIIDSTTNLSKYKAAEIGSSKITHEWA